MNFRGWGLRIASAFGFFVGCLEIDVPFIFSGGIKDSSLSFSSLSGSLV